MSRKQSQAHSSPSAGKTRWERMERNTLTLDKLMQLHVAAYRAENKSERTVQWHIAVEKRYSAWVRDTLDVPSTLAALTLDNVRLYVCHLLVQPCQATLPNNQTRLRDKTLSADTVSWHVRGLRAFASWLFKEGYTKENILARLQAPDVPDKDIDILTQDEIAGILKQFNHHTEKGSRDLAIFMALLDTGMRASELTGLRLKDLHLDQGYLSVFGKGKKERPVKVGARTIKALRFYLAHWRRPARPNEDHVFLTIGYQMGDEEELWSGAGEPLTYNALKCIMHRIGKKSGIERLHPHLLRHTFACMFLMQHHDPFALKNLLGHTSLTMTYRYVRAVERLMVVQGDTTSVIDSLALPPMRPKKVTGKR
jgi:site-specific recombinase XerD